MQCNKEWNGSINMVLSSLKKEGINSILGQRKAREGLPE